MGWAIQTNALIVAPQTQHDHCICLNKPFLLIFIRHAQLITMYIIQSHSLFAYC